MEYTSIIVSILSQYDVWNCDIESCSYDDDLWKLGMDSLTFVSILANIETVFSIRYDLNNISKISLSSISKLSYSVWLKKER